MKEYKVLGPHLGVIPPNMRITPEKNASPDEIAILTPFRDVLNEMAAQGWELHTMTPGYPIQPPQSVLTARGPSPALPTVVLVMEREINSSVKWESQTGVKRDRLQVKG